MIKREKIELVKRQVIFVGIDIASKSHLAMFIDNLGQEVVKEVSFSNDRDGLPKLENHLKIIPNLNNNII